MCGIHGVVNVSSVQRAALGTFVKEGFIAGVLRGTHSSGVFQIDKKGEPFMHKKAVAGGAFVEDATADAFFKDTSRSLLTVAHVRAATQGDVKDENAHPFLAFKEDGTRVLGVHNGTLRGWSTKAGGKDHEVDSAWAYSHIAANGSEAFKDFNGAFAFVWWEESTPDHLFMARNDERPLHFVLNKAGDHMLFASEAGMLTWLAERNYLDTDGNVYKVEADMLYDFDLSGKKVIWNKTKLPAAPVVYSAYTNNVNNTLARYNYHGQSSYRGANHYDDMDWNYTGHTATRSVYSRSSRMSDEVKEALRLNRAERFSEAQAAGQTTVVEPATPSQSKPARPSRKELRKRRAAERAASLVVSNRDDGNDGMDGDRCHPSWYSKSLATKAEQDAAEAEGVMGELQWFTGVIYEPETCELLGEFEDFVSGAGKVKYTATLRNVTASIAHRTYVEGKGDWVAVIGIRDWSGSGAGREYIVVEVNREGKAKLNKARA